MRTTILVTGGGTGGHVYPALSIIRWLRPPDEEPRTWNSPPSLERELAEATPTPILPTLPDLDVMYIGNSHGLERTLIPRAGIPAYLFPMQAPRSARGAALLALATLRSLVVIARRRPAVTLATGGYVSVPVTLASRLARVPVILCLPDMVPGKAVAWLAPLAYRIAVSTESAAAHLPRSKTEVTGYPVRDIFVHANRAAGRTQWDVPEGDQLLVVFGGSQGSRAINEALARALPTLLPRCRVLHLCGEPRLAEARAAVPHLSADFLERYTLVPYLHDAEMANALAAADLVLCRSGASVIGELPVVGAPAILVPLPERTVHQRENADYLASRGAAVLLDDDTIQNTLALTVAEILGSPSRLSSMAASMRALARPDAAERIAQMVREAAR